MGAAAGAAATLGTLTALFLGALGAGVAPYFAPPLARNAHLTALSAALGAGMLVGTALGVAVPEGFASLAAPAEVFGGGGVAGRAQGRGFVLGARRAAAAAARLALPRHWLPSR